MVGARGRGWWGSGEGGGRGRDRGLGVEDGVSRCHSIDRLPKL